MTCEQPIVKFVFHICKESALATVSEIKLLTYKCVL